MGTRPPLALGAWVTVGVTLTGLGYVALRPRLLAEQSPENRGAWHSATPCQTIATDPQPPLNVRSSPVVAPDNLISTVANGTPLQVTAETQGWLKIQSPVEGWVSQALTVTTCNRPGLGTTPSAITAPQPSPPPAPTLQVIAKAQERFQAGQLPVALALLQTLSPSDAGYAQAQRLVQTLPLQWQHGQRVYQAAQGASQQRQWQDVLEHVRQAPDIRYWREQMAPIVKQAIIQQHAQQAPISPN